MNKFKVGDIIKGQVTGITSYGVFVSLNDDYTGLVHISEVSYKYVNNLSKMFNIGDLINVKVIGIDEESNHIELSIKKIDYKVEQSLSRIPENGHGFGLLEANLGKWTRKKYQEIMNSKEEE